MIDESLSQALASGPVLVTGARGFLGTHLCRRLAEMGAEVHAVSRAAIEPGGAPGRWWRADVEDFEAARTLVATVKPHTIFHLGGTVSAAPTLELVLPTFRSLLGSTVNILTAAAEVGCRRLVLVGSLEEPPIAGDAPAPSSPYAAAKLGATAYGRMFHALYGTPTVMVRLFMTYGPGQAPDKVIPYTILSLLRRERPRLSSGGRSLDWIYVDDAIEGLLRVACTPGLEGASIDVGTGVAVPLRTIVQQIVALVGSPVEPLFGVLPDRPFSGARVADVERTYARLGWRAAMPLAAGLAHTVEWYRRSERRSMTTAAA